MFNLTWLKGKEVRVWDKISEAEEETMRVEELAGWQSFCMCYKVCS